MEEVTEAQYEYGRILSELPITIHRAPALGDTFTMEVTERRPWWAFWRKDKRRLRTYRVTGSITAR